MNTQLHSLIERQRQRMRELREDGPDLANTVADEVWDRFENEIEEITADSYMFDMATSTQMALSSSLTLNYDESFERHVLMFFDRQEKELRDAGASEICFDGARFELSGQRKGLKLRSRAEEMIRDAIERAKPGLIGMLFLAQDPCSDAWEREHSDNARRVRTKLLELRGKIVESIREETTSIIQTARLSYSDMLETLSLRIAMTSSHPDSLKISTSEWQSDDKRNNISG